MSNASDSHELVHDPNHDHNQKVDPWKNGCTTSREDKKDMDITFQHFLSTTLAAKSKTKANKPNDHASGGHEIGKHDVLLGRTKTAHSNPGNHEFRRLVNCYRLDYQHACCRKDKNAITCQIIDTVKQHGGRFLKYCPAGGIYEPISDADCYEKVSHALRSAKAKKTIEAVQVPSPLKTTNSKGATELIDSSLYLYPCPVHFHHLLQEQKRQFKLLNTADEAQQQIVPGESSAIIPQICKLSDPDCESFSTGSVTIVPPPPRFSIKLSLDSKELLEFLGDFLQRNDEGQ